MLKAANKYPSREEARQACIKWRREAAQREVPRPEGASPWSHRPAPGQPPKTEATEYRSCDLERDTSQYLAELEGDVVKRFRF